MKFNFVPRQRGGVIATRVSYRTYHPLLFMSSAVHVLKSEESTLVEQLEISKQSRDIKAAMAVHAQLMKRHCHRSVSPWNKIINIYSQCGWVQYARQLFEDMPERDTISFNSMISAFARWKNSAISCLSFYSQMQEENVKPNPITLTTLLAVCHTLVAKEQIHGRAIKSGFNANKFVGSTLVDGYSKWKRLELAKKAFDDIAVSDLICWNVIVDGCVVNGSREDALRLFCQMQAEGIGFDCFTLTSIIKTCLEPCHLHQGMQIHNRVIKVGLDRETPVGNALITMYSKCQKGMEPSKQVFWHISVANIISWTAMISGFMQNGLNKEAIEFYKEMVREGTGENEFSFASILPACSGLACLEQGMQIHARIVKSESGADGMVQNALVDMYAKCGSLRDAQSVFADMTARDKVSWSVMITAFGQHGKGREALETFEQMEKEGYKPDEITFLGVLTACSYGGLVNEGLRYFQKMVDYPMKPKREHYTCVIDLLGRAGRLKEAERFIVDMGIQLDVAAWEALLGACRIYGEKELGGKCAQKVIELEPEKDGPYVAMSNIYAERGMWGGKWEVRERLDASGLKKKSGYSWVGFERQL